MGQDFWKKPIIFSGLRSRYQRQANRKKLILPLKNTSKPWRACSLALLVHNFLIHLHFFKVGEIMSLKYGSLMLPAGHILALSYVRLWFYRWSSSSMLCFSCKNTFVGAGNLQMITSKFWVEYLWGPYALFLDTVLCIALFSYKDEAYNLRSWLHEKEIAW